MVTFVIFLLSLGKTQSANILAAILGNVKALSSQGKNKNLDLVVDGGQQSDIWRLNHSPGDSMIKESRLQNTHGDSTSRSIQSLNCSSGCLSNEMTGYVADPISVEGFKEYWDICDDDQIDKDFSNLLPIYLKSCKCIYEDIFQFLEEFVHKIDKDLQDLKVQIQSHNFQCQNQSFENLC